MAGLYRIGQFNRLFHTAKLLIFSDITKYSPYYFQLFFRLFFGLLIPAPTGCLRRNTLHQKHQFVPPHRAEPHTLTQDNTRMKPPLLKPFVIHRIAATLSVQQLHNLAVLAYKNIDITVGRIKAHAAYLTAHPVYSYTHIARMLSHDYAVVFIQIEHSVFVCKVRKQKRYSKVGFFRMDTFCLKIR